MPGTERLTDDDIYWLVNPIINKTLVMIRGRLWDEERLSSSGLIEQLPDFTWEMGVFQYEKEPKRPRPSLKIRIQEAGDEKSVIFVLQLIGPDGHAVGGIWPGEGASRDDEKGIVEHARLYHEDEVQEDIVSQVAQAIKMQLGPREWRPKRVTHRRRER